MKNNISVIIPIHATDNKTLDYLKKAFDSAASKVEEIVFVCTPQVIDEVKTSVGHYTEDTSIKFILNEGDSDFCSQVNLGIKEASCDYISILEFDDEYSASYFDLIKQHMDYYKKTEVFLPITIDVDLDDKLVTISNVAAWTIGNIEKQGFIDLSSLLKTPSYNLSGAVIKKSLFEEYGYFKSSMKLTFGYELLLRFVYNGVEAMTINKMGYKHVNGRPNSLFSQYREENNPQSLQYGEADFWFNLAQKEYFFKDDRKITFVQN